MIPRTPEPPLEPPECRDINLAELNDEDPDASFDRWKEDSPLEWARQLREGLE